MNARWVGGVAHFTWMESESFPKKVALKLRFEIEGRRGKQTKTVL